MIAACASICRRASAGKAPGVSSPAENLQNHRDDHPDGHETGRDRDEVPGDAVQRNGERTETEHGDSETEPREPGRHEGPLSTGDAPQYASGYEGHDAEPELHGT